MNNITNTYIHTNTHYAYLYIWMNEWMGGPFLMKTITLKESQTLYIWDKTFQTFPEDTEKQVTINLEI